jgi:hypothetical protein
VISAAGVYMPHNSHCARCRTYTKWHLVVVARKVRFLWSQDGFGRIRVGLLHNCTSSPDSSLTCLTVTRNITHDLYLTECCVKSVALTIEQLRRRQTQLFFSTNNIYLADLYATMRCYRFKYIHRFTRTAGAFFAPQSTKRSNTPETFGFHFVPTSR